jgi:hypothetical protein
MVGFSGFFFAPAAPARAPHERSLYTPDDIRYKFQQADLKHPKKKQQQSAESGVPEFTSDKKVAPNKTVSAGGRDEGSGSDDAEDDQELSDHEAQEEPELE